MIGHRKTARPWNYRSTLRVFRHTVTWSSVGPAIKAHSTFSPLGDVKPFVWPKGTNPYSPEFLATLAPFQPGVDPNMANTVFVEDPQPA